MKASKHLICYDLSARTRDRRDSRSRPGLGQFQGLGLGPGLGLSHIQSLGLGPGLGLEAGTLFGPLCQKPY